MRVQAIVRQSALEARAMAELCLAGRHGACEGGGAPTGLALAGTAERSADPARLPESSARNVDTCSAGIGRLIK